MKFSSFSVTTLPFTFAATPLILRGAASVLMVANPESRNTDASRVKVESCIGAFAASCLKVFMCMKWLVRVYYALIFQEIKR